jgi:pSer/pThr/pTyr-binding forkhead associated (FHA) protein
MGKNAYKNDIYFTKEPTISNEHCYLILDKKGNVLFVDKSTNGSFIKLKRDAWLVLQDHIVLKFGDVLKFSFIC